MKVIPFPIAALKRHGETMCVPGKEYKSEFDDGKKIENYP